jgi:hypothetical protein
VSRQGQLALVQIDRIKMLLEKIGVRLEKIEETNKLLGFRPKPASPNGNVTK